MSIAIITDSTCDLPQSIVKKYGIIVLPLTVSFGSEEYRDGVDLTSEQFFEKLSNSSKLPVTSQVNPTVFEKVYKDELDKGNSIISIHISSDLSGTYQSALIAKESLKDERINVIDSRTATLALGFVVLKAAQLVEKGHDIPYIVYEISEYLKKVMLLIVVDTLEYLKKGGRLSGAHAVIGTMLNIKPILTIEDGKVVVIDKVRGGKKALNRVLELVKERGLDVSHRIIGTADAMSLESTSELRRLIEEAYDDVRFIDTEVGSVIATHVGPGAYGLVID